MYAVFSIRYLVASLHKHSFKIMAKKFPLHPNKPERICWGCDLYCPADSMACGNGADRTAHPVELFGDDWAEWGLEALEPTSILGNKS